jgi:hypothetical protein
VTFYLWHGWEPAPGTEPAASYPTQHEAERAGVDYVCSFGRGGTWQAMVTDSPDVDAVSIRSFVRAVVGLYWVGMPALWHSGNGKRCSTISELEDA